MRRNIAAAIGALALVVGLAPSAVGQGRDAQGPACTDIIAGDPTYDGQTLTLDLVLRAPSCPRVTYTTYVVDDRDDMTVLASQTVTGDGSTEFTFSIPVVDEDQTVCVYTTTTIGRHVADRAPDAFCVSLTVGAGPPGQDYS